MYMYVYMYKHMYMYMYIFMCMYMNMHIYIYIYIDRAGSSIVPPACLRGAYALQYVAYASLRGQKVQRLLQKTAYAGLRGPRFRISNERVLK